MSLPLHSECLLCLMQRGIDTARAHGDEAKTMAYARDLMKLALEVPEGLSAPEFTPLTAPLLKEYFGLEADRFRAEKEESNRFVLERLDTIRQKVAEAADPLYAALQFAVLGNYIDFSALRGEVSFQLLEQLLEDALNMDLDRDCYDSLCKDLAAGQRLLYITDNAGEIGFDRVLAEQIAQTFPQLSITFCVRGGDTINDATREDAEAVGIPFPVIDNGNLVPGTALGQLGAEALAHFQSADVILSKGQGNVETLLGCGYNVYYAFLVKCSRFIQLFHKPKLTPMLMKERT